MTSEIRANTLKNRVGLGTVSFTNTGPIVSGILTTTGDVYLGGKVGINSTSPHTKLDVIHSYVNRTWTPANSNTALFERSGINRIAIVAGASSQSQIDFADTNDDNAGYIRYDHSDNSMSFRTNGGSERLRITSDGKVGISETDPQALLHLNDGANSAIMFGNTTHGYKIRANVSGSNDYGLLIEDEDGVDLYRAVSSTGTSNTNTHTFFGAGGEEIVRFNSSSTELIRISGPVDASTQQEFGIGIAVNDAHTHPAAKITLKEYDASDSRGDLLFYTRGTNNDVASTERLRILSDGKVLIGHTSNIFNYKLAVFGTDGGNSGISASRFSNNSSPSSLILSKSRGTSIGSYTIVQDNDEVGMIDFRGADGSDNMSKVAEMKASIDGTPGSNDMPGRLTFHTTADGASSTTERLRIDSGGKVGVNEASNINGRLHVQHDALGENILYATRYNDQTNDKPILAVTEANMSGMTGGSGLVIGNHNRDIHIGPVFGSSAQVVTGSNAGLRIAHNGLMGLGVSPTSHNSTTAFQIYDDYNSQGYPRIRLTNQSTGTTSADGYEISLDGSNLHALHRQRENADIYFMTNNLERLRIDSSGRLLIGTSDSRDNDVYLQLEGVGYQSSTMQITRNSNNADGGGIYIAKTRGTADGQSTIVQNGDELGYINFRGADGTDGNTNAATIQAFCDGAPGSNDMPGRLVFSTTADGASSATERLRIDRGGNVKQGTSTNNAFTSGSPSTRQRFLGPKCMQGTVTDTTTLDNSGNGTFDLGKLWITDDTSIEMFIQIVRNDSGNYTTHYAKAFIQKVRGSGMAQPHILYQNGAAAANGFSITSVFAGGYTGSGHSSHGTQVSVTGGAGGVIYRLTCFYTAISKNDMY